MPVAAQAGNSPWLPEPEALNGQLAYVYQSTDSFFLGNTRASLPADLEQHTVSNYLVTDHFGVGVNYQVQESLSGIDIGAPGFTFAQFPGVNEDAQVLGGVLSYRMTPTTSVSVSYAGVVDGRNTSYSDIAGINIGYSLF